MKPKVLKALDYLLRLRKLLHFCPRSCRRPHRFLELWRFTHVFHGKDRSPAQHQWQTRAGSILDSDLFAARRKWCIRCPPAIKNGQSPLMPVVASLNLTGPAAEDTSTPVSKATQRSEATRRMPSSSASGLSLYVSFKAQNDSHRQSSFVFRDY